MLRQLAAATLLCGTAFAADTAPIVSASGDSPAFQLVANGLSGSGNQIDPGPKGDVMAGDMVLAFQKMSLKDVVAKLGGATHITEENGVGWVCYISPEPTPVTIWFGAFYTSDGAMTLSGVGLEAAAPPESAGCTTLADPLIVTTGAPGLGATTAELDATFGEATDAEPDGTVAYFFGSENQPDGINALTKERKYRMVDGVAVAISAGIFNELQ